MNTYKSEGGSPPPRPNLTVLVEELPLVRHLWREFFRRKRWPLIVFENPMEFLRKIDRFTGRHEEIHFFFDQDFGSITGVGLELARAVRGRNVRQVVSLVTYHDKREFHDALDGRLIHAVYEKYPRTVFGDDYPNSSTFLDRHVQELSVPPERGSSELEQELGSNAYFSRFSLEDHFPELAQKTKADPTRPKNAPLRIVGERVEGKSAVESIVMHPRGPGRKVRWGQLGLALIGLAEIRCLGALLDEPWLVPEDLPIRFFWEGLTIGVAFCVFLTMTSFLGSWFAKDVRYQGVADALLGFLSLYLMIVSFTILVGYCLLPAFITAPGRLGLLVAGAGSVCHFFIQRWSGSESPEASRSKTS